MLFLVATNSSSVSVLKYARYNCSMIGWIKAQSDAYASTIMNESLIHRE